MSTLPEFLAAGAQRWPDQPWCETPDGTATRGELYADALRVAGGLTARGVTPGDRVVVVLPNGLDFLRTWFGIVCAGAVSVATNPRAAEAELPAVLAEISPRLVIAPASVAVPAGWARADVAELCAADPAEPAACTPDTAASFIQSSGSTGRPKFVIETHGMYTMAAEGFPYWLGLTPEDVLLTTLPLSHLNAQVYSTLGSYGCGARLALLPRFSASGFFDDARRYGATQVNAIGAMLEILLEQEPSPAERDHGLRLCYLGPAPTPERHREIEERFGFRLVIGYALSESPYGLICPLDEPPVLGSMGRPRQHPALGEINTARLVDPATGADVAAGTVGELLLRNIATTPGYWGLPEETGRALRDGWLHTGDLAYTDEGGNYFFAGRLKEIIRRRGENLSPADVEVVLNGHPAVSGSAVIGVPSPLTEEDIKAFVLVRPDATLSGAEVAEWCASRLPPYKRPKYVEFVTAWPLTETQKIAKKELPRERTEAEIDLEELTRA